MSDELREKEDSNEQETEDIEELEGSSGENVEESGPENESEDSAEDEDVSPFKAVNRGRLCTCCHRQGKQHDWNCFLHDDILFVITDIDDITGITHITDIDKSNVLALSSCLKA